MDSPKTKKSKSRQIIIWLSLLLVILILALILFRNYLKSNLDGDEYKSVLEFVIIIFGGGFISIAFERIKKEQELREARRQYLRDFYLKAVAEYNKVKKCRRLLRARAIYQEKGVQYLRINESVQILTELEDSQLEFEGMLREIEIPSSLFTEKDNIEKKFTTIVEYLAKVLEKFEDGKYCGLNSEVLSNFDDDVEEFTTHYKKEKKKTALFFTQFANSFDDVRELLIKDIQKA